MKENAKLNLYNQIIHVFEREKYLDDIESFKMRKSITKFRCSNHKLEIEVGRHKGIASDERVCKLCPNELETESHFLSKCTGYEKLRRKIFGNGKIESNFEQDILACKIKNLTLKLGKFLLKANTIRDQFIDAMNEHNRMLKILLDRGYILVN